MPHTLMVLEEDSNIEEADEATNSVRVSDDDASLVSLDETQVVHLFGK